MALALELFAAKNNANPTLSGSIGVADTTIALTTGHGARLPTIINGSATSGGNARTLNSTGIQAAGVAVNDFIYNITDGSWGIVIEVSTNSVRTTPLRGGSDNLWDNSDTWAVGRFIGTLVQYDADGDITKSERVLVKTHAASADSVTVSRSYGGDTAQTFVAGDSLMLFVKEEEVSAMQKAIRDTVVQLDEQDRGTHAYAGDTGAADAYVATFTPKITSLNDIIGKPLYVKITNANTGASTLAVNGLTATAIKKEGVGSDLVSNDLKANQIAEFIYNGTYFQLTNPVANPPAGGNLSVYDKTGNATLATSESGGVVTNKGATAAITLTLPTPAAGINYKVNLYNSKSVSIAAGTGKAIQFGYLGRRTLTSTPGAVNAEIIALDSTHWFLQSHEGNADWTSTATYGYWCGGFNSAFARQTDIQRLAYSGETTSTIAATIASGLSTAAGVSSALKGYVAGGSTGSNSAAIQALSFNGETVAALAATLDTARRSAAGFQYGKLGFVSGGIQSSNGDSSMTDDIDFMDETSTVLSGTLATAVTAPASLSAPLAGYIAGGHDSSARYGGIQKMPWSTETFAAITGTLDTSTYQFYGVFGSSKGYLGGGDGGAGAAQFQSKIEDVHFTNDTSAVIAATLNTGRHSACGVTSTSKGYWGGGEATGPTYPTSIEDMNFSTEASVAIAATLPAARNAQCGIQDLG